MSDLTIVEARELVLKPLSQRRRPTAAFIASRQRTRAERHARGERLAPDDWVGLWDEYLPVGGAASSFNVVLDTTGPGDPSLEINGGATSANNVAVTVALETSDSPTTGYQIKIWGSGIDTGVNGSIQDTEGNSSWISPTWSSGVASQAVTLTTGDGTKNVSAKIRDDVWNETTTLNASITLNTAVAVASIVSGPDTTKVSKISGKRTVIFAWEPDIEISEYKVKVVPNSGSAHDSGTVIPTTNGSSNVAAAGTIASGADTTTTIDGRDLELASAGDGTKVVKVFVLNPVNGLWST